MVKKRKKTKKLKKKKKSKKEEKESLLWRAEDYIGFMWIVPWIAVVLFAWLIVKIGNY
tara:strand:+ start:193 stop:366 length:174 start_codon:yes stop_codon:yes gene_type:complete